MVWGFCTDIREPVLASHLFEQYIDYYKQLKDKDVDSDLKRVAKAQLKVGDAEQRVFDSSTKALQKDTVVCYWPGRRVEQLSVNIIDAADYIATPRGDKFVLVKGGWFCAPRLPQRDGTVKACTVLWTKVVNPRNRNQQFKAIEGVDYLGVGFVKVDDTFMSPHHRDYLPIAQHISVLKSCCDDHDSGW